MSTLNDHPPLVRVKGARRVLSCALGIGWFGVILAGPPNARAAVAHLPQPAVFRLAATADDLNNQLLHRDPRATTTALQMVTDANNAAHLSTLPTSHQHMINRFDGAFLALVSADSRLLNTTSGATIDPAHPAQNRGRLTDLRTKLGDLKRKLDASLSAMQEMKTLPRQEKDPYTQMAIAIGEIGVAVQTQWKPLNQQK